MSVTWIPIANRLINFYGEKSQQMEVDFVTEQSTRFNIDCPCGHRNVVFLDKEERENLIELLKKCQGHF